MLFIIQNFGKIPDSVKTTILYLYFELELYSNETFYKACVPLGHVFLATDIASVTTMISK